MILEDGPAMAHDGVKHDYHLVNPSPWPLVGSVAAVVLTMGFVIWWKGLFGLDKGTWWVAAAGAALMFYTMIGWWRSPSSPTYSRSNWFGRWKSTWTVTSVSGLPAAVSNSTSIFGP